MGYSRGWGVRTTLSPFRTLLSPQHSHISGISLPWLPTSVTPPLVQAVRGLWSSDQKQNTRNFQETKFSFFLIFFSMCFKREKRREAQQPGYELNCLESSATPTICTFRKCFPLKCSPCICSSIGRRMNSGKQRRADEIRFIYSLIPNSLPHSEIP